MRAGYTQSGVGLFVYVADILNCNEKVFSGLESESDIKEEAPAEGAAVDKVNPRR